MDEVILIDKNDKPIGTSEKLEAHKKGLLHRAFSILVFNKKGELLLQKRAENKYHSGGLWSTTACSHPKPNEKSIVAAHRRLKEEMGFDCDLEKNYSFFYKTNFPNGLIENECDYVFMGKYNGKVKPDPNEVVNCKWISMENLKKDIKENPDNYAFWFKKIIRNNY